MRTLSRSIDTIRAGVFADLQARIDAHTARGGELVPLHIGDTFVEPPEGARVAKLADEPSLYRYGATAGLAALRDAIAARARARFGFPAALTDGARNVLLGAGATHALFCAARTLLDPGDDVLLCAPYWPLAHGILSAVGANVIEVPFTDRLYDDPTLDPASLLAAHATERTRALYLITPNNPDGKILSRAQLESIAAFASARDLWIIADEAYAGHAFDLLHVSIASLEGMAERTLTASSLSKSHALAGARLGAVIAPADVVSAARRVGVHTTFNVPVAMQRLGLAALAAPPAWESAARGRVIEARAFAVGLLRREGFHFHAPEGGTYVFLDLRPHLAGKPPKELLEAAIDRGVLLAPGDAFGRGYESHARLCFTAVEADRLRAGVARLRSAIDAITR